MAKKITGYVKLQVPAGAANPSPPIGPALGQRGLNIMEFCKAFNAKTAQMEKGTPIPVIITAYQDRSFTFEMKQPPVSYFLKKAAEDRQGLARRRARAARPARVTRDQIREIAEKKMADLNCDTVECRHGHDRGLRPLDGPGSGSLREGIDGTTKESASAPPARASSRTKLYPHRRRGEARSRSAPRRSSTRPSRSR